MWDVPRDDVIGGAGHFPLQLLVGKYLMTDVTDSYGIEADKATRYITISSQYTIVSATD